MIDNPYEPPLLPNSPEPRFAEPPEPERPTAVTVFGILNIVFGALGVLCSPLALSFLLFMPTPPGQQAPNPAAEMLKDPTYRAVTIATTVAGTVASGVLLVAGIGLLKLKPWGRTLSIGYGAYGILATIVAFFTNYVFFIRPLLGAGNPKADPAAVGGAIGAMFGPFLSLIYPVLLLVFMTLPKVVRAFERKPPGTGDLLELDPI